MAEIRHYLTIVQDQIGYSRDGSDLDPPEGPKQPMIWAVVKLEDHEDEVERLRGLIAGVFESPMAERIKAIEAAKAEAALRG